MNWITRNCWEKTAGLRKCWRCCEKKTLEKTLNVWAKWACRRYSNTAERSRTNSDQWDTFESWDTFELYPWDTLWMLQLCSASVRYVWVVFAASNRADLCRSVERVRPNKKRIIRNSACVRSREKNNFKPTYTIS